MKKNQCRVTEQLIYVGIMPTSRSVCILHVWLPQPWEHGVQTVCGAVEQWRAMPAVPLLQFSTYINKSLQVFRCLLPEPKTTKYSTTGQKMVVKRDPATRKWLH